MPTSNEFTPREFFALAKEVAEHEAELKIKLAKAGIVERSNPKDDRDKRQSV